MIMENHDIRICFIGDSFVNGTGDPEFLGWTGRLCQHAARAGVELTGYNLGVRRDTSRDISRRWLAECQRRLPTACDGRVVFSFGVNDTTLDGAETRVDEHETLSHAQAMLEAAVGRWATLMVGPPPVADATQNERIARLDESLSQTANGCQVPYLSIYGELLNAPVWQEEIKTNDGSHPRAGGYDLLATLVKRWPAWWFR